ncbi:Holliday junction branch migration protein RuvA [Corynebacterium lubricantis]|uniref:Holliday junction branch migration protein RuvA n=1 Tax=Corynebacterium lubricantis TaxID=541095 RepID=UPI00037ED40F|nr:Holliday junction branch migration protein RuvA [Corynebacterium lubricantis]
MIDSLNGEVLSIGLDHAVIECGGVGYRFLAAPPTLGRLTRGESTRVLTAMVVKEDSMTLYGFINSDDRELFHTLQSVSGLGPKLALATLSLYNASEVAGFVSSGDVKALQTIPGVGKRMAERMALELKDKLKAVAVEEEAGVPVSLKLGSSDLMVEQVVEALIGLGFTEKSARPVVESVVAENEAADTSTVLRTALAQLGRN